MGLRAGQEVLTCPCSSCPTTSLLPLQHPHFCPCSSCPNLPAVPAASSLLSLQHPPCCPCSILTAAPHPAHLGCRNSTQECWEGLAVSALALLPSGATTDMSRVWAVFGCFELILVSWNIHWIYQMVNLPVLCKALGVLSVSPINPAHLRYGTPLNWFADTINSSCYCSSIESLRQIPNRKKETVLCSYCKRFKSISIDFLKWCPARVCNNSALLLLNLPSFAKSFPGWCRCQESLIMCNVKVSY